MSPFGRRASAAMEDFAVKDHARADSCSDTSIEDVAVSPTRAPQTFRQRGSIRIVVKLRHHPIAALQFADERKIPPARNIRRVQDHSGSRIERPWSANADRNGGVVPKP